jgi:hypothetical protein
VEVLDCTSRATLDHNYHRANSRFTEDLDGSAGPQTEAGIA